jgi:hypothetical protein
MVLIGPESAVIGFDRSVRVENRFDTGAIAPVADKLRITQLATTLASQTM